MKKICYLLLSKNEMKISPKELLQRVRKISGDPKGCSVINAARGYANHYDFAVICEKICVDWPQWLKYQIIVCVPDSNMVALLLAVGEGVVLHITVPERSFVTSEMSLVLHCIDQARASLPVSARGKKTKIWKSQMNELLLPFKNG
jgi:hypothetical protein